MKGKVYLVGAGPGDDGLITVKGLQAIKEADVIVYDRLANDSLLRNAKKDAEMIYVGKKSNNHTMKQEDINSLLGDLAEEGKIVTRLKGGDPYVFGRGGEEGEHLYDRDIEFETIPGITSAIGGLCYAGIPITSRDYASSFHVFTGHLKKGNNDFDWKVVTSLKGTLVFLMGMSNLNKITNNLINNGKAKTTPVCIINWATRSEQKVVTGRLQNIVDKVKESGIKPPSLIVIGEVVNLREKLKFFERKLLFGKNVVVTRSRAQSSSLVKRIEKLGGEAIEFPAIRISPVNPNKKLENAINKMEKYSYIIFTSVNGVKIFFENLNNLGYDARKLYGCKIVAIGSSTSKELENYGIKSDIIPKRFVGEEIYNILEERLTSNDSILIPRSGNARSYLVDELGKICNVDEIVTYETVLGNVDKEVVLDRLEDGKIDYITFTSSSTVKNFVKMLGKENLHRLKDAKLVSIGPITSKTIEGYGLNVHKEAENYTIDGVVNCIINDERR